MKIIMMIISMLFLSVYLPNLIIVLSLTILSIILMNSTSLIHMNTYVLMDKITYMMIMLTMISIILIMLSSTSLTEIFPTIISILTILILTFSSSDMLNFYILFELVLIPTMLLIMTNGKQPERLQASLYLIMYTILASLPLLISILLMKDYSSFLTSFIMNSNINLIMFTMMAFLVKMPMYFSHLWLPKAHVEAPLEGSMILAAVLLKLGGYGLIRFMPMCIKKMNNMNYWIISISLIGATATSLNCIQQKDLKSLIAYSSVAHMGFALTGIMTLNSTGIYGAIIMMIAHGLSASALFLLVNDMYIKYHTRSIMHFKGLILIKPNIIMWWFLFMAVNMSAPPTINTISEILLMSSLINWNMLLMIMMFSMSLMTASFSMMMFINISHNQEIMLPSTSTNMKMFTSLFIHLIPLITILMLLEMILK